MLGGGRPYEVMAMPFAFFFPENVFDEPAVIAQDGGLAVADERELAGLHRVAGVARLLFRQPNGADMRLAIRGVGDALLDDGGPLFSGDVGYRGDAFHHRGMSEEG